MNQPHARVDATVGVGKVGTGRSRIRQRVHGVGATHGGPSLRGVDDHDIDHVGAMWCRRIAAKAELWNIGRKHMLCGTCASLKSACVNLRYAMLAVHGRPNLVGFTMTGPDVRY